MDPLGCILGKLKAKKAAAALAFKKADVEEYDNSDEIVIVTDSDNDESAVEDTASVVVSYNWFGQNNHCRL